MSRISFRQPIGGLVLALLCVLAVRSVMLVRSVPHRPAVLSDKPIRVSEQRCAECHFEIVEEFTSAPHSRTLHHADEPEVLRRFGGRTFHRNESGVDYRYVLRAGRLTLSTGAYAREMPIDWVFGSGTHAQTPLMLWTDNDGNSTAIEHSVSWYPDGELGVTLGVEKLVDSSSVYAIGRHWGPAETINCFGCHSTYVPTKKQRILFESVQPGISCARCHWNTADHVKAMEEGDLDGIERFSQMTPLESIDRCGECHRRAAEMGGPVTSDNEAIIRFAPVGLSQSPCFLRQQEVTLKSGQTARLDCTTCHDPHRPTVRDWRFHAERCLTCHDEAQKRAPECTRAARGDNCLPCHMPKISVNDHLQFTDHWIRVRKTVPAVDNP